jgi:hypothetical protein
MDTAEVLSQLGRDQPDGMSVNVSAYGPWFRSIFEETALSDEALGRRDIALQNLKIAAGLPGAEDLDRDACAEKLKAWTRKARDYTEERRHLFTAAPREYWNSPGKFRMLALVTFVQKRLHVQYNLAFSDGDYNGTDSRKLFVHGVLDGHGGTCATLPVLYVAIGRRLGYPLKLVRARDHLFARWEEPQGERFNIECTSPGFRPLDDDYFRRRPKPLTEEQLRWGAFLRSLSPRDELADFLCNRTYCLMDNLELAEALQACYLARKFAPDCMLVRYAWAEVTVMARAMEAARERAGLRDYDGLDLRDIPVAGGAGFFERWAVPVVRDHFRRIAWMRENPNSHAPRPRLRPFEQVTTGCIVRTCF